MPHAQYTKCMLWHEMWIKALAMCFVYVIWYRVRKRKKRTGNNKNIMDMSLNKLLCGFCNETIFLSYLHFLLKTHDEARIKKNVNVGHTSFTYANYWLNDRKTIIKLHFSSTNQGQSVVTINSFNKSHTNNHFKWRQLQCD